MNNDRDASQSVRICTLTQAASQGLSARIRFASVSRIFNFAVCFRRPRYLIFRKCSCCFTAAKTCSTLARTEDFSHSLRSIYALDRAEYTSGSRFLPLFLAEDGASMKVESTIMPFFRIRLRSVRYCPHTWLPYGGADLIRASSDQRQREGFSYRASSASLNQRPFITLEITPILISSGTLSSASIRSIIAS